MRQPHTTPRQPTSIVYPWMKQIQEIRLTTPPADAPDQGADLFELLETRQFRRATTDNGVHIKSHDQELSAFSTAIDAELQLAARSAPERMTVAQITQLLRLEQDYVSRMTAGQNWLKRTQDLTSLLRDIQSTMSREIHTTRITIRPLIELLDHEARILKSQFQPVELWYWMLIDTTSGLDDASPLKRQILRPILNAMRLAAALPDQPFFIREELLLATILSDLPLFARAFRPSRRPISEPELERVRKSHANAAVALAMSISDIPTHVLSLVANHHQVPDGPAATSSTRFLRPLAAIQSITTIAHLLSNHQARQTLHDVPLSSIPSTLSMFQQALNVAQTTGQLTSFNQQLVLAPWKLEETLATLPESTTATETQLQRLQRLLQQSHMRLDPPEQIRAPNFQSTRTKRERKRRLTSYPGPKKRVLPNVPSPLRGEGARRADEGGA